MKKLRVAFLFLALFALAQIAFSQNTYSEQTISKVEGLGIVNAAWLGDYRLIAGALCMIAVFITALAYFGGSAMQNDQLKAFAKEELMQAAATMLIVIAIVGTIAFADSLLENVTSSREFSSPCPAGDRDPAAGESRMMHYASCYIENLFKMADYQGEGALREAIEAGRAAYKSTGYQSDASYLGYSGAYIRLQAYKRLDLEVKSAEFSYLSNIMISLSAQMKMLLNIVPVLGPAALLMGVILRCLFFTRKLGGLLIAVGAGLLIVYPATYLLSWVTLQSAVFGPQITGTGGVSSACPAECKILPPVAYLMDSRSIDSLQEIAKMGGQNLEYKANTNGEYGESSKISTQIFGEWLDTENNERAKANLQQISLGKMVELRGEYGIMTCFPKYSEAEISALLPDEKEYYYASQNCPADCRYIPFPQDGQCNRTACDMLPNACKVIRAMGADSYTTTYEANNEYCLNTCTESMCPSFCKLELEEVKLDGGTVVPSANAGKCTVSNGKEDLCSDCPAYCKQYYTDITDGNGNYMMINEDAKECASAECKACLAKEDSSNPDCMLGIPSIRYDDCDSQNLCGSALPLASIVEFDENKNIVQVKNKNVCPIECRIYYGDEKNEEAYMPYADPYYFRYCLQEDIRKACLTCPSQCMAQASALGAQGTYKADLGGGLIETCAIAPEFGIGGGDEKCTEKTDTADCLMKDEYTGDCARCPLSCRFVEPSSLNEYDKGYNAFKSDAHYPLVCKYYPDNAAKGLPWARIEYESGDAGCAYKNPHISAGTLQEADLNPAPPTCSPVQQIYALAKDTSPYCPKYLANTKDYALTDVKTDSDGYLVVTMRANKDASAECTGEDIAKFCSDTYCPQDCKVSRKEVGPYYCDVDVTNQYSVLINNSEYCGSCYNDGGGHETGAQCQVLLIETDDKGTNVYMPKGCDLQRCAPGSYDENTNKMQSFDRMDPTTNNEGNCVGFCYPRLEIPSSRACGQYDETGAGDGNRTMADAAACPMQCRYAYDAAGGQANMPQEAIEWCGYDLQFSNGGPKNCDMRCDGYTYTEANANYCTNRNNGNAICTSAGTVSGWIASGWDGWTAPSSACPCDTGDEEDDDYQQNVQMCSSPSDGNVCRGWDDGSYTYRTSISRYSCERQHKYIGWDDLVDNYISDYIECGEIVGGAGTDNPQYNFCAEKDVEGSTIVGMAKECKAYYNARAVACLPYESYLGDENTGDMSTIVSKIGTVQTIALDDNCQQCPLFLRIEGIDEYDINWVYGGLGPTCSEDKCDVDKTDNSLIPPGYCGIEIEEFDLKDNGGSCALPTTGSGVGCPVRCRIEMPGGSLPAGCDSGEIMDACAAGNMYDACKKGLSVPPCAGCVECEEDCQATPYVRQDCSALCTSDDMVMGGNDMSVEELVSSYKGADATKTSWQAIGSLMIPAIILPMFSIIIFLAFVRVLSPLLGGDIEIPGLFKLI